jgi:hypothetical protein
MGRSATVHLFVSSRCAGGWDGRGGAGRGGWSLKAKVFEESDEIEEEGEKKGEEVQSRK